MVKLKRLESFSIIELLTSILNYIIIQKIIELLTIYTLIHYMVALASNSALILATCASFSAILRSLYLFSFSFYPNFLNISSIFAIPVVNVSGVSPFSQFFTEGIIYFLGGGARYF